VIRNRSLLFIVAGLSLQLGLGCSKGTSAAEPPPEAVAKTTEKPAEPSREAPVESALKLRASKVAAFLGYSEKNTDMVLDMVKRYDAKRPDFDPKKKRDSLVDFFFNLPRDPEASKEFLDREAALRNEFGLSKPEVDALEQISRGTWARHTGMSKMMDDNIAMMEKQLAKPNIPAETRAAVEETIVQAKADRAKSLALTEARTKYGDEIVDAMLPHEATFTAQAKKLHLFIE
jgi:hypothetical protein